MKDELEQELIKKYPKIFKDARHPDAMVSAMHWGISVGDGWYHIIDNGCWLVQNHIDHTRKNRARALWYNRAIRKALNGNFNSLRNTFLDKSGSMSKWQQDQYDIAAAKLEFKDVLEACPQVIATQVKEKFGDMRFYYDGGNSFTSGVIDMMESMTSTTCDNCGAVGAKGGGGWISVKCAPCRIGFKQTLADYEIDDDEERIDSFNHIRDLK
jgi:hypothetical protein